jgi:hypothetical protein
MIVTAFAFGKEIRPTLPKAYSLRFVLKVTQHHPPRHILGSKRIPRVSTKRYELGQSGHGRYSKTMPQDEVGGPILIHEL